MATETVASSSIGDHNVGYTCNGCGWFVPYGNSHQCQWNLKSPTYCAPTYNWDNTWAITALTERVNEVEKKLDLILELLEKKKEKKNKKDLLN